MAYLFLALSGGLLIVAVKWLGIVPRVKNVMSAIRAATAAMRSRELTEEQKEIATQRAALEMLGSLFSISARVLVALAVPAAFIMLGSVGGLYDIDDAVRAASDWYFIAASTMFMIGALVIVK